VNALQEQAKATEELIAMLLDTYTKQMENLIKTTNKAMKEMTLLIKKNKLPASVQRMQEKKTRRKNIRNTTRLQSVNTAEGNTPTKLKTNAGSWKRIKTHAPYGGSQRKAPEGVWGLN
jgi:hypothetical protein